MKKAMMATAAVMAAAIALAAAKKDEYDIRPGEDKVNSAPTAVAWQNANDAALAAAVGDGELAEAVETESSARRLLAEVKGAYLTDATAATKIAAVSQWVMGQDAWYEFWKPSRADGRKVWAKALMERVRTSSDSYVRMFCLDQLRWCGYPCQIECIKVLARVDGDAGVKAFAQMVARELESARLRD
jgi:hypothetical protein